MWKDLESVIQSEVSQKQKNKYRILTHICGIQYKVIFGNKVKCLKVQRSLAAVVVELAPTLKEAFGESLKTK